MGSYRHHTWLDVGALDEHLTVFLKMDEALERFLGDIGTFSRDPYKISTDSGLVERTSRAQISDAADSLGGSLNSLDVWYAGPAAGHRVNLDVRPYAAHPLYRIGCALHVFGDNENETNGRFDTLRNRMDAEINRQWSKSTAAEQVTKVLAPTIPSANPPAASPTGRSAGDVKQWVDGFLRHPLWSAIIAGIVVVGIVAVWTALT